MTMKLGGSVLLTVRTVPQLQQIKKTSLITEHVQS